MLWQGLLGAIVAIACLAVWGSRSGASALLGAGIGVAATSLMAFAMLRHGEGASAQRVAWSFFSGWVVKVGFTLALLVVAFRSTKVDAVAAAGRVRRDLLRLLVWGGPHGRADDETNVRSG